MSAIEQGLCLEVEESLSDVLDGTASARLFDHIADCDACRDLRHEAARAAERVGAAGGGFHPADDFAARLLARIEVDRPIDAAPATAVTVVTPAPMSAPSRERVSVPTPTPTPTPVPRVAPLPVPTPARQRGSMLRRPAFAITIAGVVAVAAATAFYLQGAAKPGDSASTAAWSGTVSSVARAAADPTGGLEACDGTGVCAPVAAGGAVRAGATLRTDPRTRAHVLLADGTELAIDRGSEVEMIATERRGARVRRGSIVADVAHVDGSIAHFAFARGDVEVLGTKLGITAGDDRAAVEVARGAVRVRAENGTTVDVRAGEEATLLRGQDPIVASSTSLADVMEWSDRKPEDTEAPVLRGLGELRARKPGQTTEKDRAVRLAKHAVKVRIVDVVARTEVDETFANDTDEELEGIFRFPLPPGAQIEKLALEVDGKMIDGAFVDRDRGAAIWRGVIQNAAPKAPKPREEIIWVPGPWRDPALLEWQRGGRFELKIFPIPKRGARRVVLTYTQTVDQAAGIRRFTYPLAHDPSGTTKVDAFDLDVQVLGLDAAVGLSTRGYELVRAPGDGERRTLHADAFVPAGDLTVEYALPDRDKEATAWAYVMAATAPTTGLDRRSVTTSASPQRTARPADEQAAIAETTAILEDASPYVAIALRPKLPRWHEAKERVHAIVVDASRSMVGERFARARVLASSIVREMDRRDSFVLLACDTVCRPMSDAAGASAKPAAPGAASADNVERFLGAIEPDGGSDLAAAIGAARSAAGALAGRELRILYLGDGTPSVGPTHPAHLEAATRAALFDVNRSASAAGDAAVIAVALGADADTVSLAALARGGGGVLVPYVPGQKVSSAALDVLGAAYGVVLRDVEVELPVSLRGVSPARIDPIRAGGETILVARMTGGAPLDATIKLRGRVGDERFEQTYPIRVVPSSSAGNAFVPRLYAATKMAELERLGGELHKPTVIELSKRFAVASRFTSLIVLESEAMFRAFGLDRVSAAPSFTGEEQAESSSADAEGELADPAKPNDEEAFGGRTKAASPAATAGPRGGDRYELGDDARGGGSAGLGSSARSWSGPTGIAQGDAPTAPPPLANAAPQSRPDPFPGAARPFEKSAESAVGEPQKRAGAKPCRCAPNDMLCPCLDDRWRDVTQPRRPPPRRMVPMRRVFDRRVSFDSQNTLVAQTDAKLTAAERSLAASPDSRAKTADLYALYAVAGRVNEAQELSAKWSGRDALDPDALAARADLAARQGDRDRAVRILGGLADLRPADRAVQARLAELHDAAGNAALACEHRIALAELASGDAKLVADAVRCARAQGMQTLATLLHADAGLKLRDAIDRLLVAAAPAQGQLRGDVQLTADWQGGADLDVALIDAQGHRISWLGAGSKVAASVRDATSTRTETLALAGLPQGSYVVEIARAGGGTTTPIRGDVTMRFNGEVRKLPFTLTDARVEMGTVRVFFTSRLVPAGNQIALPF